ncbi:hypothetical protein [Maridesulfovibrio sp. FT414]|uniref:hypothetical protein n=1 Tax=Maridesulfovibrio sp. FT414 TaxID=2979469 RepID=UPI003D809305
MNMVIEKQPPLKHFIVEIFGNGELLDATGIHELVSASYSDGAMLTPDELAAKLEELQDEGLLLDEGSYMNDDGKLIPLYRISELGLNRLHEGF